MLPQDVTGIVLWTKNAASLLSKIAVLESHQKQIEKLDLLIENLYEDKISDLIPNSLFKRQIMKFEQDRTACEKSIKALEKKIKHSKAPSKFDFNKSEPVNREMLFLLVDKIVISEAKIADGKRVCEVKIFIITTFLKNAFPRKAVDREGMHNEMSSLCDK